MKKRKAAPRMPRQTNGNAARATTSLPAVRRRFPSWDETLVALGLSVLVIRRLLQDGIVHPHSNAFFLFAIVALFLFWGVKAVIQGERLRFGRFILLWATFHAVAWVTGLDTVQYDATHRTFLVWAGHFFLFVLATNALRSRTAIGIVLAVFACVLLNEAIFAVLHKNYLLPQMRQAVLAQPELLVMYFGSAEVNPVLADRLSSNRAFGHFLFSNALAAFLIMGAPVAAGAALHNAIRFARMRRGSVSTQTKGCNPLSNPLSETGAPAPSAAVGRARRELALIAVVAAWAAITAALLYIYSEFYPEIHPGQPWRAHWGRWTIYVGILPLVITAALVLIGRRYGLGGAWLFFCACFLVASSAMAIWSLMLTYSRGGLLALFVACGMTSAVVLLGGSETGLRLLRACRILNFAVSRRAARPSTCLLVLLVVATALLRAEAGTSPAESADNGAPVAPSPVTDRTPSGSSLPIIHVKGVSPSLEVLMNPTSLWLRFSYWRSAFRMIRYNFWTGVGLGNFGTVYPKYQSLGAGDVRMAHNDYIQVFCETGLFGFLAFCAFWLYFVIDGAKRLVYEQDASDRWMLAGLYTSVLAFLFHTLVDFDFYNPTLAFYLFLFAGLLLNWSESRKVSQCG